MQSHLPLSHHLLSSISSSISSSACFISFIASPAFLLIPQHRYKEPRFADSQSPSLIGSHPQKWPPSSCPRASVAPPQELPWWTSRELSALQASRDPSTGEPLRASGLERSSTSKVCGGIFFLLLTVCSLCRDQLSCIRLLPGQDAVGQLIPACGWMAAWIGRASYIHTVRRGRGSSPSLAGLIVRLRQRHWMI